MLEIGAPLALIQASRNTSDGVMIQWSEVVLNIQSIIKFCRGQFPSLFDAKGESLLNVNRAFPECAITIYLHGVHCGRCS